MCVISQIFYNIFNALNEKVYDVSMAGLIVIEFFMIWIFGSLLNRNQTQLVCSVVNYNLNRLNEKNIYEIMNYLITEFKIFSDVTYKFNDKNLDLFLENYVIHLKHCEDGRCPCKNYIKKVEQSSNTVKSNYQTQINFTHLGSNYQEEYILNKFFNVLCSNVTTTLKYTNNNVNLNAIKDNNKQKIIYNLRVRLIQAVKKLISYRLEILFTNLEGIYSQNFSNETKHFIRINFFAMNLICNRSYYKTIFLFHEFLSEYYKKFTKKYDFFLIYYFYLKKLGINEYNEYVTLVKNNKKENSMFNMDFRSVLGICTKFYDIEKKIVDSVKDYEIFIHYFEKDYIHFDKLLKKVSRFKSSYKNMTKYIRYFFKNDKINNLFVCSKIILYFKILQFDIPENLHNKLIVQNQETNEISKTNHYIDNNYYIIANYSDGDFIIKFISHELLIILEYSEDEITDQDFHMLMPEKMRYLHKNLLINEIKNKNNHNVQYKEIFLVSKRKTCVLFDLHYKILLNLKGEITVLCVINLKKPKIEYRTSFVCVDDNGEVLAVKREFEEYLLLSMKMLDYVKIDSEKLILQNLGNRIRSFFKEEENHNSEFFEKFDYEYYLSMLFGEEFEALKDRNEALYKKKYNKWEVLKEIVRKSRYSRFIDIYVKMRMMGNQRIYFIKYLIKANFTVKSFEPYNTTSSPINAVKISKREMAKLSFYKMEEIYEAKSEITNDDKLNESHDFLNESQSILSSAASILKQKNSKRLFKAKRNRFKFLPKSRNILILTIFLAGLSLCSIVYNIVSMFIKHDLITQSSETFELDMNVLFLKEILFSISSAIISLARLKEKVLPDAYLNILNENYDSNFRDQYYYLLGLKPFENNTIDFLKAKTHELDSVLYSMNYLNNKYYNTSIFDLLNKPNNNYSFIFENGLVYNKNDLADFMEISSIHKMSYDYIKNYSSSDNFTHFQKLFLFKKDLKEIENLDFKLSENDIIIYYFLNNIFDQIEPFTNDMISFYGNFFLNAQEKMRSNMIVIKIMELIVVIIIIIAEVVFIFIGYEKAKKKMRNLKSKVKSNNVNNTLKKIEEFIKFCNTFNIYSLYMIADFELAPRKSDEGKSDSGRILEKKKILKPQKQFQEKEATESFLMRNLKRESLTMSNQGNQIIPNTPMPIPNPKLYNDNLNFTGLVDDKSSMFNKSIQKLENIRRQRRATAFYKKNSGGSQENIIIEKNSNENSNVVSENDETNLGLLNRPNFKDNIIIIPSLDHSLINNLEVNNLDVPNEVSDTDGYVQMQNQVQEQNVLINKLNSEIEKIGRNLDDGEFTPSILKNGPRRQTVDVNILGSTKPSIKISNSNLSHLKKRISFADNSGQPLITQDESSPGGLIKNKNRGSISKRIRFTDKNVKRFYSPEKNVNDKNENPHMKAMMKIAKKIEKMEEEGVELPPIVSDKQSPGKNNCYNFTNADQNNSYAHDYIATASDPYKSHNLPIQNSMKDVMVATTARNKIKEKTESNEIKDVRDIKDFKDFNLLRHGTTVKKKTELKAKDAPKQEEIEDYVEQIVHSNLGPKIILSLFSLMFLGLYIGSLFYNFDSIDKINTANKYSHTLFDRTILASMLAFKYETAIVQQNVHENITPHINRANENIKQMIQINYNDNLKLLPMTNTMEKSFNEKQFCDNFASKLNTEFNYDIVSEKDECNIVGNSMNSNGFSIAYQNLINVMQFLSNDLNKLEYDSLNNEKLLEKLNDLTFFNVIIEIDYTFRKYNSLLSKVIKSDIDSIYTTIRNIENVFSYMSIFMNLFFTLFSLVFIIFPIKYVEMMISWLIHKLLRS